MTTRVLVVDDSVVVRRLVARVIESDPTLELAGVARDGAAAVDKTAALRPDVVVLDLEMPILDGLGALAEIRRTQPELPIIIFSHLTSDGAAATLDAIALGATDFALKPRADGLAMAEEFVRQELLPRIKAVAPHQAPACTATTTSPRRSEVVSAVVIGVSTGGPNALADLVPHLPANLSVPVLIVQHMPELFTKALAERLDRLARVPVTEGEHGQTVEAGHVYIAPGGRHLSVEGHGRLAVTDGPPVNSCRPAADVLFRSAAAVYGPGVLGLVLTGMGHDGTAGARAVRAAGGHIIVQSPRSCVVPTMPSSVVDAGLADAVVDLDNLGPELVRRVTR